MSNHDELTALHHSLKDIEKQLKKNASQLNWILILAGASFVLTLVNFMVTASK